MGVMNQSTVNFYEHITTEMGIPPADVDTDPEGPAQVKVGNERYLVQKRYGGGVVLHSDAPAVFIKDGGKHDHLVVMPENPDETTTPVSILPLDGVDDVKSGVPRQKVKEHAPPDGPEFWEGELSFTLAHRDDRVEVKLPEELSEKVRRVAGEDPAFSTEKQVVEAACRELVDGHETYGEAT
jgi:hypothetical protein